ncbi:5-deoxy-glucuronate isomerase [Labrys monachus]|uniref:5-deoxy-glucuronate isomerase n=1 Tax=Labrys monachus TaxID=217067 RepID=A0ABU0FJZ1_9HYPH|nr:5-deoxy-glucuronate isomerase [Labrys monachus]MDQ0394801.1 5-deoxy-glucuronate isomerase [Labrys monachus]
MTDLLVKPNQPDADGRILHITPQSAGWGHVGFDLHLLAPGQTLQRGPEAMPGREILLVLVGGLGAVRAGGLDLASVGGRMTPFDDAPHSVYLPPGTGFAVTALTPLELAVCSAPATGLYPPRLIRAEEVEKLTRGTGTNTRHVRNILPETAQAEALLVVESVTPGGHWSSYPPHKHDTDDLPRESRLEETYYHRLRPEQGYALQRVYTDDRSIDETMAAYDRNVVLVPRGYHPVAAPYGFDLYYLNVMAGPVRTWRFQTEASHAFLMA